MLSPSRCGLSELQPWGDKKKKRKKRRGRANERKQTRHLLLEIMVPRGEKALKQVTSCIDPTGVWGGLNLNLILIRITLQVRILGCAQREGGGGDDSRCSSSRWFFCVFNCCCSEASTRLLTTVSGLKIIWTEERKRKRKKGFWATALMPELMGVLNTTHEVLQKREIIKYYLKKSSWPRSDRQTCANNPRHVGKWCHSRASGLRGADEEKTEITIRNLSLTRSADVCIGA